MTKMGNMCHIVIPVLDRHNGSNQDFTSIESNADEIIDFIDQKFSGVLSWRFEY